ncbi:transient receptor potential cation channel subfamily M member 7-like isoform X2 [Rana temporaria]|uniref:transient receptor potential cation channel subfamily M member 7-like isoform X2 n=1 Tax=Rana temporaria TaxID=8407 RepID=UPI001AAD6232|nr:transient receptor potential cation channel subfamily M member 7-like isoform X2 [Rana temporaria]
MDSFEDLDMVNLSWIEKTFYKRDCVCMIPSSREPHRCIPGCQICHQLVRCCCGRLIKEHSFYRSNAGGNPSGDLPGTGSEVWTAENHTVKSSTDAYGTIDFQGGSQTSKAKYVRLSSDSKVEDVLHLMVKEWRMQLPKLVISVHGGKQRFDLHPHIKEALSRGLVKVATTTGSWIFTGGVDNGVAEHIGDALKENSSYLNQKVCTVGIAPWGVVEGRQDLVGRNIVVPYQALLTPLSKLHVLNSLHSHFILVDDGTVGRHGAEVPIRKNLESRICLQQIHSRTGKRIPIVALILEGGPGTILTVFEYLQQSPPVPVVVCEGSGRAADLLAYVYKHTENQGNLLEGSEADVIATIKNSFNLSQCETAHIFQTLLACMKTKYLITVYRAGPEEQQDIDVAILTSLLKSTNLSPYDQLVLALAWDREDIAKDFIFVQGRQWLTKPLEQIMLDALVMNRVAFVKLLIEKGVSMHRFLTIPRLEELYNAAQYTSKDTLLQLIQDVTKGNLPATYKITLLDVGLVIEYLMGGTYRCNYTKRNFRTMYKKLNQSLGQSDQGSSSKSGDSLGRIDRKEKTRHGHFLQTAKPFGSKNDTSEKEKVPRSGIVYREDDSGKPFLYPYNELLVWAVLMKRQKMSLFFWQHGEESMAKALVARCLFRAMSREAKKWDIIDDTPDKLKEYSKEFGDLAVELLHKAYQSNEIKTMKILTYELRNWSKSTCLKLAVSGKLQSFVSHECTQKLLTEIWMGRLNLRKNSWLKVILGIFLPPVIPFFNYKTKAQMSHIPLSEGAHQMIQSERDDVKYSEEGITLGACKERAFHDGSGENHAETRIEGRNQRLPLAQKYFAFYHAPIVKFWFNTLAYLAFLMLYTYVVLVKMETLPSVQEWIVIITIVTTGVETMREIFVSEAGKISQKLKTHFSSYLNINEFLGILTFLIGFGLRFGSRNIPDSTSDEDLVFVSGRIIYCLNTMFWFVRLLDLLNVNQDAGLYVFILAKMVSNMFFIVVIMGIVVVAFGVPKQGILHPHEEPSFSFAQDVAFRPYWMMFGEMFAYEIDPCANDSVVPHLCVTGSWLNGYLQAVYVFVQYIIMVNLLIAIFNNVYAECKAMSNHLWKFQRYFVIMFYQGKPVLPPPFVLFSHITTVITWLCRGRPKTKSQGPKLFLTEEDQIRLHEFEGQCVQIYFNDKKDHESSKSDERIRVTTERVEDMLGDVKDVRDHVGFIKQLLHHLDDHIGHLQDLSGLTLDSMKTLTAQKALEINRSHSIMSSDISRSQQTTDDGLGHSVMWRKSRSDQVWSRSLSQPGLDTIIHPKASISLRRINSSDTSPTHSSLFLSSDDHNHDVKFDDLEFQKGAFSEHKVGYSQPKSLKIHNSSVAMIHSPQTLPQLRVTPKLKDSLQSQNVQLHTFSVFTDSACSVNQGNTLKEEGIVNLAFIDDRGNAIHKHDVDHVGSDFKISDEESTKKDGQLSSEMSPTGGSDCPNDNIHESKVKPPSKSEQLSNSSTFTEMFQKLWTRSKHSGFKLYKTKQLSEDTESTHSNEDGLRRTSSCTDLNGFQPTSPSTSNSQFNMDSKSMSYEDLYQIDSKAALLKEPYYSRYSSAPKSSLQKKTFTRFGHDFKTSMDKSFYYSAIERNNLYRLSQSIPFTPLPPVGELATVYRLEESSPNIVNNSMSSWSHNGYYSTIEILTKEEMGGGLRRAVKVACTWSENDILKAGHLYIIKSFLPEVVNNWSGVYKDGTVLQLCLREIQQQRAAQKLLFAFNQMKPKAIPYTPKFLEVFLLYCHSVGQWFTIEECMAGRFRKYNNNTGNETVPSNKLEKTMLAFSHWTYEYTRGEFLVLDLQGVGENLTDPSVIKAGERRSNDMVFGPANLGDDAIKYFCANHQCNSCCKHLKLPEIKRNDYVVDEALLRGSALLVNESHGTERPIQQPLREDPQC